VTATSGARTSQKLGSKVIKQLTTIVAPSTLLRWIVAEKKGKKTKPAKGGRPGVPNRYGK
jgi:hypothetical protein